MKKRRWYVGELWTVKSTILHPETQQPVDPTTVATEVTAPDGTVSFPPVTHDGQGLFHATAKFTAPGTWKAVTRSTGGYEGVEEIEVVVWRAPRV
jgi:hypothetical protein